ncbi:MAG: phenylalanine--tRNA ligase subunit beta [Candidatus Micrarchaeaceae archaeon]
MPVISFNKKYIYGLLGSGIDEKKLDEQVSKLGFEVESVDSENISLEVTANRLDLLDAVGFARALKNFMHKSNKFRYGIKEKEPAFSITVDPSVKRIRPFISGLAAYGVKIDEGALANMINYTEKLCETYGRNRKKIAMGFHDLDSLKPPLVYKSAEDMSYVPLGKEDSMKFSEVLEGHEKGRQYGSIIKSAKRTYYPAIIDSAGVMSFIPILNSHRTRITTATKNVFVDITGTSEYAVNKISELIAASFMDLGADVRRVRINYGKRHVDTPEMELKYITMPLSGIEREIGVEVGYNNIISLANKMGYEAALLGNDIRFSVPEYRLDVIDKQDIIEDIAIGYGYDYINPLPVYYSQQGSLEERTKVNRRIVEIMIGLGFSEMTNSYLTNASTNFVKPCIENRKEAIELKDSKTETISIMRTWIIPSLLSNLGMSAHERMPQDIFELDMAFLAKGGKPVESYRLGCVSINPKSNFNGMKAAVEGLLSALGKEHQISEHRHGSFIDGRCAAISVDGKEIGFFGELHPKALKNFGIEEPGTAFELDLGRFYAKS